MKCVFCRKKAKYFEVSHKKSMNFCQECWKIYNERLKINQVNDDDNKKVVEK